MGVRAVARVLVVEDDEDIRRLIVTRIQQAGHRVVAVGDAESALAFVAERGAPEVAVLDVGLPGMSGLELLVKLRDVLEQPDFPCVILSARVNQEDVEAGRALGATYLTKPPVTTALIQAIEAAVSPAARGWS
jgi:DNA-binding response OmpR family regulator